MARILIVEDQAENAEILQRLLSRNGHDVVVASSRDAAIAVMTEDPAELVLMDIWIPDSDGGLVNYDGGLEYAHGLEATRWIKANPPTTSVPIIAVSASNMLDERKRFLEAGCDDVQPKPYEFTALLQSIDAQLTAPDG